MAERGDIEVVVRSVRDLAGAVRGRRQELGMSQAELARRAGVSRKWIYEFEGGKPTAELVLLLRVLDEIGLALALARRPREGASTEGEATDLDALLDRHRGR